MEKVEFHLSVSFLSGLKLLCCFLPTVWKQLFHILFIATSLVIYSRNTIPLPVILSWETPVADCNNFLQSVNCISLYLFCHDKYDVERCPCILCVSSDLSNKFIHIIMDTFTSDLVGKRLFYQWRHYVSFENSTKLLMALGCSLAKFVTANITRGNFTTSSIKSNFLNIPFHYFLNPISLSACFSETTTFTDLFFSFLNS